MRLLVTGAAGFIGYHLVRRLLQRGDDVLGLDNLNDYYDVDLKLSRLSQLRKYANYRDVCCDIAEKADLESVFLDYRPQRVVNLAAQAGVRYSLVNPTAYSRSNLEGFVNVLECCRRNSVEHLVYASSSSVYGGNLRTPYSEHDSANHPLSLYAATKKANELMAHAYSHLFDLPTTGLRFFTVYGPWGRPDMALSLFAKAIFAGEPLKLFNNGQMVRDFTYIDDIVESIVRVIERVATSNQGFDPYLPDPATSTSPYRIFNIGNRQPVALKHYIEALEDAIGIRAEKQLQPMQPGDVLGTAADTAELTDWIDFTPATPIAIGIGEFVKWYRQYHKL